MHQQELKHHLSVAIGDKFLGLDRFWTWTDKKFHLYSSNHAPSFDFLHSNFSYYFKGRICLKIFFFVMFDISFCKITRWKMKSIHISEISSGVEKKNLIVPILKLELVKFFFSIWTVAFIKKIERKKRYLQRLKISRLEQVKFCQPKSITCEMP